MSKKVKNNLINRILRPKKVQEMMQIAVDARRLVASASPVLCEIGEVQINRKVPNTCTISGCASLLGLLDIHKKAWKLGFQCKNLGPSRFGEFRTESISNMTANDVYLGNIYGLWTFPISKWEESKNEGLTNGGYEIYHYCTVYQIILMQYKDILTTNIRKMKEDAEIKLRELTCLGY